MTTDTAYNNFIGMYQNVYPEGFCEHMIHEFERLNSEGNCIDRKSSEGVKKTIKSDRFVFLNLNNHALL